MMLAMVLTLLLAPAPAETDPGPITVNQLLAVCEGGYIAEAGCFLYVTGFFQAVAIYETKLGLAQLVMLTKTPDSERPITMRHICFPVGTTGGQTVRVAIKFLKDHPERLH